MDPNVADLIDQAADQYGVPRTLAHAVAQQESGGNQSALSNRGAQGVMQVMPGTAHDMGVDPNSLHGNIIGGVKYLRAMLDRYNGNIPMALAAYNAGPGRVDRAGGIPNNPETQAYVPKVMARAGMGDPNLPGVNAPAAVLDPELMRLAGLTPPETNTATPNLSPAEPSPQPPAQPPPTKSELMAAFSHDGSGGASGGAPTKAELQKAFGAGETPNDQTPNSKPFTPQMQKAMADAQKVQAGDQGDASMARLADQLTLGFGPMIAGGLQAGYNAVTGGEKRYGYGPAEAYQATVRAQQAADDAYAQKHPLTALGQNVVGFLAPGDIAEKGALAGVKALGGGVAARVATRIGVPSALAGVQDAVEETNRGKSLGDAAASGLVTAAETAPFGAIGEVLPKILPKAAPIVRAGALPLAGSAIGGALGAGQAALTGQPLLPGAEGGAQTGAVFGALGMIHGAGKRAETPTASDRAVALDTLSDHFENNPADLTQGGDAPTAAHLGENASPLVYQAASEGGKGGAPVAQAVADHMEAQPARVHQAFRDVMGEEPTTVNARADQVQETLDNDPQSFKNQQEALAEAQDPQAIKEQIRQGVTHATGIDPATAQGDTASMIESARRAAGAGYDQVPGFAEGVDHPEVNRLIAEQPEIARAVTSAQNEMDLENRARPGVNPPGSAPNPAAQIAPNSSAPRPGTDMTAAEFQRLVQASNADKGSTIDLSKIPSDATPSPPENAPPAKLPTLAALKRAASDLGEDYDRGNSKDRRSAAIRNNALNAALHEYSSDLAAVDRKYGDTFKAKEAYERGKEAMAGGRDVESAAEAEARIGKQTPIENHHELRGIVADLNNRLEGANGLRPKDVLNNDRLMARLRALAPATAEKLEANLKRVQDTLEKKIPKNTPDQVFRENRQAGAKLWTSPPDPKAFARTFEKLSKNEKAAMRVGALGDIGARLQAGPEGVASILRDLTDPVKGRNFRTLVGDEAADKLIALARREMKMTSDAKALTKASAGAPVKPKENNVALGAVVHNERGPADLNGIASGALTGLKVNTAENAYNILKQGKLGPGARTALGQILAQPSAKTAEELQARASTRARIKMRDSALSALYHAAKPGIAAGLGASTAGAVRSVLRPARNTEEGALSGV